MFQKTSIRTPQGDSKVTDVTQFVNKTWRWRRHGFVLHVLFLREHRYGLPLFGE